MLKKFYDAIYYLFSQIVNTQICLNMFVGFEHACLHNLSSTVDLYLNVENIFLF